MTLIPGYMVAGTWEDDDNGWPKPDLVTGHSAMSQLLGIRLNASVVTNNGLVSFTIHQISTWAVQYNGSSITMYHRNQINHWYWFYINQRTLTNISLYLHCQCWYIINHDQHSLNWHKQNSLLRWEWEKQVFFIVLQIISSAGVVPIL